MIRETSAEAYRYIRDNGLLSKKLLEVYHELCKCKEPATSGEIFARIIKPNNVLSQTRSRFTELRDMGLIQECDKRPCRISGRSSITWQVTGALPSKVERPKKQMAIISIKEAEQLLNKRAGQRYRIAAPGEQITLLMYQ